MALPTTTNDVTTRRLGTAFSSLWTKIKSTFQTLGNLVTAWGSTPSDTKYPSEKLVKDEFDRHLSYFDATYVRNNAAGDGWVKLADIDSATRSSVDNNAAWDVVLVAANTGIWRESITLDVRFNASGSGMPQVLLFNRKAELSTKTAFNFCVKVVGLAGSGNTTVELWAYAAKGWYSIGIREAGAGNITKKKNWNYYSYSSDGGSSKPVADAGNNVQVVDPAYVDIDYRTIMQDVSKGANLVVNGSGRMGNNYNFSGFTYLPTICNNGSAGSFGFNGEKSLNEYISVDFTKRIFFTADIKNLVVQPSNCYHRICVKEYDIDKREIVGQMVLYGTNTLTTLAEDLNPGDTTVHITDASHANWQTTTTHCKGLIFWNYSNSYGYTYPPESYSRNVYPSTDSVSLWDDGAVNASTGVITLKAAWSGPAIPAGTKVSRRSSGNNFPYPAGALNVTNTDWHTMSGYMQGVYDIGENKRDSTKFSYGTAFIKVGMYPTGLSNTDETTGKRAVVTNFYVYECSDLSNTSGVLPISKGGTGQTTATAGQYELLGPKNVELTAAMSDGSRIMFASTSASTSTGVFAGYRQASAFWTYIKDKISSVLGLSESGYTGNSATASAAQSGSALETAINGKQDALAAQTAYSAKGSATKVPQITTNALGQVTGITEVTISGVTPASHTHGNMTNYGVITGSEAIANGDAIVVANASDSNKLAKTTVTFDGSTTTTALTPKGTFETFQTAITYMTAEQEAEIVTELGDL